MLKALNEKGVRWLTRVCQVAWKFGKTQKDWQTGVVISIHRKAIVISIRIIEEHHSLFNLPGKMYAKSVERNAEK